jgi:hypothetical protein
MVRRNRDVESELSSCNQVSNFKMEFKMFVFWERRRHFSSRLVKALRMENKPIKLAKHG